MVTEWELEFTDEAEKGLEALDRHVAQRVMNKLRWLAQYFEAIKLEPLTGRFRGAYKLRIGAYRMIYTIDRRRHTIVVLAIGHRRYIYETD